VAAWALLSVTTVLIPVAVWLGIRWILVAQVVGLEGLSAFAALRRSGALVRGHWVRGASLVGVGALLALATGPLLAALLICLPSGPLARLNVVAGLAYGVAMPFAALTSTYVYFGVRARSYLEPRTAPAELPAAIELASSG